MKIQTKKGTVEVRNSQDGVNVLLTALHEGSIHPLVVLKVITIATSLRLKLTGKSSPQATQTVQNILSFLEAVSEGDDTAMMRSATLAMLDDLALRASGFCSPDPRINAVFEQALISAQQTFDAVFPQIEEADEHDGEGLGDLSEVLEASDDSDDDPWG